VSMKLLTIIRYMWALPNTMLGLLLVLPLFAFGGRASVHNGVLEFSGRGVSWFFGHLPFCSRVPAMTLGHVVIGVNEEELSRWREHERVHVRQYERWGPFMIPAYLLSSLCAWARGKDGYAANRFEAEAYSTKSHKA
jgi:hypothetical protein